jgi:hypothetical protein
MAIGLDLCHLNMGDAAETEKAFCEALVLSDEEADNATTITILTVLAILQMQ